jgi:hypothetical protein
MNAYPRNWAGQLMATDAQVATADRLIELGLAQAIPPRDYCSRAGKHLQLKRMLGWRSEGKIYVDRDGEVVGWGWTLVEARRNGLGDAANVAQS